MTATDSGIALMPRTLIMVFTIPIVGRLYNKISPALTVAFGVLLFCISCWQFSHLTRQSGTADIILPQLVGGAGFACLFVPLTTTADSGIRRDQMADATGLNSFIRQIGGSVGLAIFVTALSRWGTQARAALSAAVTALRPEVAAQVGAVQAGALARMADPIAARALAMRALGGRIAAEGMIVAFEKAFLVQGIAFLAILPLLFYLRRGRAPADQPAVAME